MCGLAGFFDPGHTLPRQEWEPTLKRMTDAIQHRGPDDEGAWFCEEGALGFRRLAILDLSPQGHQPMHSVCGRYHLVFNGEIYNFSQLKKEVVDCGFDSKAFRGHSDTEVLLAAFTLWGVEATLPKLNGMFAFAVWQSQEKKLFLARDRMGKKPLYYAFIKNALVFASELKSIALYPGWRGRPNAQALSHFFSVNCIPAPLTIYEGAFKVKPAHVLKFSVNETVRRESEASYWATDSILNPGERGEFSDGDVVQRVSKVLEDAVKIRLYSDVPLGAFLSGGVDSSLVVALMQKNLSRPAQTFSIGFVEKEYDESSYARAVSRTLGTEHTEWILRPEDVFKEIPNLASIFDEPFADSSQLPTLLVSKLAKKKVTVALSGDGGDEVFGGYNRHRFASNIWPVISHIPNWGRPLLSKALDFSGKFKTKSLLRWEEKAEKLSRVIKSRSVEEAYWALRAQAGSESLFGGSSSSSPRVGGTPAEQMMGWDLLSYLPDDILTKVDRATMAVSLEARAPLLDYRLVELMWSLPVRFRVRKGTTKWVLREILKTYLPSERMDRPKAGFALPLGTWMRQDLRPWVEEMLNERALREDEWLHAAPVRELWRDHLSSRRNYQDALWSVLMYRSWKDGVSI